MDLCKIQLDEKEQDDFIESFTRSLNHLDIIKEVDLDKVEPTFFVNNYKNPLREDKVGESLPLEEVIRNAPEEKYGYFKLRNVME